MRYGECYVALRSQRTNHVLHCEYTLNEDMLKQCHKELDGNKAVGIDKVTKDEYGKKGAYHLPTAPFIISPILFFSNSLTVKILRSTINFYLSDIVYPL